jgi:hypothetical protein
MSNKIPVEPRTEYNIPHVRKHIEIIGTHVKNLRKQGINNIVEIEMNVSELFPEFYEDYMSIVKRICRGDDMKYLEEMFCHLEQIQTGKQSLAATELKLGEKLAKEMLYPSMGIKK